MPQRRTLLVWGSTGEWSSIAQSASLSNQLGYTGIGLSSLTPYAGGGGNPFDGRNHLLSGDYDASGNQQRVGSLRIGYDAENRQRSVTDALDSTVSVQYQYDGEGNRVSKSNSSGTTVYVYDAFGQLAAEYSNGAVAASPCKTCYLAFDHLGSVRLVMDEAGNVVGRHDYLPFGEEVTAGVAGRNTQFGVNDGVKQKFTGQERDSGTVPNLDYFYARYFNGEQGRFLSPDPENAGADLMNPQSWNGYSYAGNSPMVFTDPSGMMTGSSLWGFFSEVGNRISSWFGAGSGGQDPSYCLSYGGLECAPTSSGLGENSSAAAGNDGLIPLFTATGLGKRDVATVSTPSKNGPTFTKTFLPPNANICFDNQNYFYAPPTFDITKIEAAGKSGGYNPQAMNAAVGHYGSFDFQRVRDGAGNTTFYSGYTPVSNFSVGAYLYSAGFSKSVASFISNTFALFKSSNAGDPAQATFRNLGYDTAARGQRPVCQSR